MTFIRSSIALGLFTLFCFDTFAQQNQQYGYGMMGGTQGCGQQVQMGDGASSYVDDIREAETAIKEATREMQDKKREKKRLDAANAKARANVESVVSGDFTETIFSHLENRYSCQDYQPKPEPASQAGLEDQGQVMQGPPPKEVIPLSGFSPPQWAGVCTGKGTVSANVCQRAEFRSDANEKKSSTASCSKGLAEYGKGYAKAQKLQDEVDALDERIKAARDSIKDSKQAMADELKDQQSDTQSGICVDCMAKNSAYSPQQPQTNWGSVAANVGTGLLAMYAGYKTNKTVAEYNSSIGQATQAYPAWGYGLPYIANGLYGAISGGTGQGAFGCGANNNSTGGAFGYPANMMGNQMGGGMYAGGYGNMMSGSMMNGYGNMMGSMMGSMMNGYGQMMGSMMSGGLMMGSMMGNMMSGGQMMGSMMGNMMSGGQMMGSMMGSMMSGGYMMGSMMGSMMSGGYMMSGGVDQSQLLQQYQAYQQQQLQKQQVMAGLQSELQSLISRINSVQYGYTTTGYIGSSTSGSSITGGVLTNTLLNSGTTATTPVSGR